MVYEHAISRSQQYFFAQFSIQQDDTLQEETMLICEGQYLIYSIRKFTKAKIGEVYRTAAKEHE